MNAADRLLAALGRRARERRAARGLTLRALAARSGLSQRFLVQVEAGEGNISVRRLAALASALGTSAAELLEDPHAESDLPSVSLLGLRGAGKSTIGRRLARRLHVPFVELDREVAKEAGLPLEELFRLHGEAYYRRLERRSLERLLAAPGPLVLATGGGLVTSSETYELLRRRTLAIWLRARPEDHWSRVVQQGDRRPMKARPQAMSELRRLLADREPLYALAAHAIDTTRLGIDGSVRAIQDLLARSRARAAASPAFDLGRPPSPS